MHTSLPIPEMSVNLKFAYLNLFPQSLSLELHQFLSEAVSSGYNGALLICGAFTEEICFVIDNIIIKQVKPNTKLSLKWIKSVVVSLITLFFHSSRFLKIFSVVCCQM